MPPSQTEIDQILTKVESHNHEPPSRVALAGLLARVVELGHAAVGLSEIRSALARQGVTYANRYLVQWAREMGWVTESRGRALWLVRLPWL